MNFKFFVFPVATYFLVGILNGAHCFGQSQSEYGVKLQFSDGRPDVVGFDKVNGVLRDVGVRASMMDVPAEAIDIIKNYESRKLTSEETQKIRQIFTPNRDILLDQIMLAGRTPTVKNGGDLTISEVGGTPYPKFSDMKTVDREVRNGVVRRFSKLHFNTSEEGVGVDEVMTVITGGPFILFFVLPDLSVSKLTIEKIQQGQKAVRLSYPGIGIHGGFMTATTGMTIGYAHGPKNFVVRFEDNKIKGSNLLGNNPWVDYSNDVPQLRDSMR